jgi:hypothetical protein
MHKHSPARMMGVRQAMGTLLRRRPCSDFTVVLADEAASAVPARADAAAALVAEPGVVCAMVFASVRIPAALADAAASLSA